MTSATKLPAPMGPTPMIPLREGRLILPETLRDMANPPWEGASARILVVRLSAWSDVDISSPHLVLFAQTREAMPGAFIDFAFLPPAADRPALDAAGIPWFFGRASGRSPADFDLVMVSNAYALELVNLPRLFSTSGLPVRASLRLGLETCPIVILGGSNASCTGSLATWGAGSGMPPASAETAALPAPAADLAVPAADLAVPAADSIPDGIFFGEGEGAIGELASILCAREGSRAERLARAAETEGFWPCLQRAGARRRRPGRETKPLVAYPVLNGASSSTARLAISSGCPGFCSFCLEGWDRRPYRELPLDKVLEAARELKRNSGADTLDVYSFNFNTHADVDALILELNRIFDRVSFMSQRLDILARSPGLAALEMAGGKKSFTLGIEGISERMRAYYRKGLSQADLDACLRMLLVPGVKEIKLFYIISGTETPEDIEEFSAFLADLAGRRKAGSSGLRIIASAGFLVRLPFTPLQFAPLVLDEAILKGISAALKARCESEGIEYREATDYGEFRVDQELALDNGKLLPWLESLAASPWVYDASMPKGLWQSMKRFLADRGKSTAVAGTGTEAGPGEKPAWWRPPLAFAEPDERHLVLRRHYEKARIEADRAGCLGGSCSACGACDDAEEIRAMTGHRGPHKAPLGLAEKTSRLLAAKAAFPSLAVGVEVPGSLAFAGEEYRKSWLLRKLFSAVPGSEKALFSASELYFGKGGAFEGLFPADVGRCGHALFTLRGPDAVRLKDVALGAGLVVVSEAGAGRARPTDATAPRWIELEVPAGLSASLPAGLPGPLGSWLTAAGIPHTMRKTLEDGAEFTASPSSLGKRVFSRASIPATASGGAATIVLGDRASLRGLPEALASAGSWHGDPWFRVKTLRRNP